MLCEAAGDQRQVISRKEIEREGTPVKYPRLLLRGWAARVRQLADGRRQLLSFVLPGDLIGLCAQPRPLAVTTVIALSDVAWCIAPSPGISAQLADAYATGLALEEAYRLAQICRLGRLNAQERMGDLLLELLERLSLAGLADENGFDLPLTQEMLADALGLTPVHINRTLQQMRRAGDIDWKGGRLTIHDPATLAAKVGREPVRVSG
ncbi:Crp/Fnr family transcriptional regulator [Novosphingobium gossypii]|uniref:Crp/Fnr family transcriptional regulator n=1 Tax=Novosphingobium gossypii TaxID=1604774 RepID=UPI003D24D05E